MALPRGSALLVNQLLCWSRTSAAEISNKCINLTTHSTPICSFSSTFGRSVGWNAAQWQTCRPLHSTAEASTLDKARLLLQNYKQLCKAKLSAFVVLTAGAGYVLGSGASIDVPGLLWTSIGTFACAASANSLNQVYERVNDSFMQRTRNRPLPAGRMSAVHALVFAATTGVAGVSILATQTNSTTAALGAGNILLYAGIYTPMKQLTIWNTWLGAIVGAVPPLMGWAAAAGELSPGAAVLATTLYFWQLPHFLALAWMCKDDYARGGFRMISMFDATGKRTAAAAVRNCAYLLPIGLLATGLGVCSHYYTAENVALSLGFAYFAARFWRDATKQSARQLFRISLLYLPISMVCAMVHRIPQTNEGAVRVESTLELPPAPLMDSLIHTLRTSILNMHAAVLAAMGWTDALWPWGSNDLKCPSKAYGDSGEGEGEGSEQPAGPVQQSQQESDSIKK